VTGVAVNVDPQKFFIGVIDFFSVLMPGAMLAFVGAYLCWDHLPTELEEARGWIAFFFASYLLGHFAFLFGAILDEVIYAPLLSAIDPEKATNLEKRHPRLVRLLHSWFILRWVFGVDAHAAVGQARLIKTRALGGTPHGAINTYQWCKALLSIAHPPGLVAVQRLEADSKFFRSLVVVLLVLAVVCVIQIKPLLMLACLLGLVLALGRYIELRFKGTQQAYWFVITLDAMPAALAIGKADPKPKKIVKPTS
jgi:hypothetical protein